MWSSILIIRHQFSQRAEMGQLGATPEMEGAEPSYLSGSLSVADEDETLLLFICCLLDTGKLWNKAQVLAVLYAVHVRLYCLQYWERKFLRLRIRAQTNSLVTALRMQSLYKIELLIYYSEWLLTRLQDKIQLHTTSD